MIKLTSRPEKIIAREMLYITKAGLSDYDYRALVNDNMLIDPFTKEGIALYKETPTFVKVPLYSVQGVKAQAVVFEDLRSAGTPITFQTTSTLRDGQIPVVLAFKDNLRKGASGFIINAPTAWGKTRAGIEMAKIVGATTLIVVHTTSLLKQWKDRILQHTDLTDNDIGIIADGKTSHEGKAITIGLVHTLGKASVVERCRDYFGFVLFDEVDRSLPPDTFSSVAENYYPKIRAGISATLTRQDKKHIVFEKHLKQILLIGEFSKEHKRVQQKVIVHRYPVSSGVIKGNNISATQFKGRLCTLLAHNRQRNEILASYAVSGYNSGRKTCIISDRTIQLYKIKNILTAVGIPEEHIGYYCDSLMEGAVKRSVSEAEKVHAAKKARIMLGTYRMMEAGTDIPDLALMILGTPLKFVTQTKGRTERPFEKAAPVLVDVVDVAYERAVFWFEHRLQVYVQDNMPVKVVEATSRVFAPIKNALC